MAYLEIKGPRGTKRLSLEDDAEVTIGRHPDNLVVLRDDRASRHHCILKPTTAGWQIEDLGSANGTKLNTVRLRRHELLGNGDVVRIGSAELRFIDPDQPMTQSDIALPEDSDPAREMERQQVSRQMEPTLDIDLNTLVSEVQTDYEKQLGEIIKNSLDDSYGVDDISLVDCRGTTVHQAQLSGLDSGSGGETVESVRLFRLILCAAFKARATDIHVESRRDDSNIRLRVDGSMVNATGLSATLQKRLLGMVKILCQLEGGKRNAVQDGHFSANLIGRRVDFRVSLTPSMHGQKLVIRILDAGAAPSRLHELGLQPWMYDKLRTVATRDAGLLLACGPTGSGKTTTLYSCLREIDVEQRNAVTIEDPVEYYLEGTTQIPIDHEQGTTFATVLRSVLRQDPDVIFVGEIRDIETANVAMQAAMTGHLVYSTVHAKDSIGAIFRLLDLGVEAYLVANALNLILAQRLVRLLCPACRKPVQPTSGQVMRMGHSVEGLSEVYAATGCRRCLRTGFHGRRALFELLEFNDAMRDNILRAPSIRTLREIANQGLFTTLQQFGYQLVANGETAIEEIDRVAGS